MQNQTTKSKGSNFPTFRRIVRPLVILVVGLITLVALIYAEEDFRGKRAWTKYKQELEAKGVDLDWHTFAPPPVPDEQNFAMTPFLAPLFDFNPLPLQEGQSNWKDTNAFNRATGFSDEVLHKSNFELEKYWHHGELTDLQVMLKSMHGKDGSAQTEKPAMSRTEAAAQVLQELKKADPVLDELRVASRRPAARFKVRYDGTDPWAILLPHLAVVKGVSHVVTIRTCAELAAGNADGAMADIELSLYLADSIKEEPFLISYLVRIAILRYVEQNIWEGLAQHRWTDAQLRTIQDRLLKMNLLDDVRHSLAAERAAVHFTFEQIHKNPGRMINEISGSPSGFSYQVAPGGWLYLEELTYQRFFEEKILSGANYANGAVNPKAVDETGKYLQDLPGDPMANFLNHRAVSQLFLPAYDKIYRRSANAQATVSEAILACALERFRLANGKFPESLEELMPKFVEKLPHDVIGGDPLKYRRTSDDHFVLYSIGWNAKDDGGKTILDERKGESVDRRAESVDITLGDWVWPEYPKDSK